MKEKPARAVNAVSMRSILYDATGKDRECELADIDLAGLEHDQLLWVDITGRSSEDLQRLPEELRSTLREFDQLGGLERFDSFYRFAIPCREDVGPCLQFVVGRSWILTSSQQRPRYFDEFVEADRGETLKGRMTSTAFMAALLLRHLDELREEIASVDASIDKLDDTILLGREKRSPLLTLAALRRRLSGLRGLLGDQRSVIHGLVAPDFIAHVAETDREFLVEVNRGFERLEDDVVRARETVIGSFELYASRVAQDTNQLVKVLTIATVITGVIGAVAGVFGMNFDTPLSHSGTLGFLIVTGSMIAVSVSIVIVAVWRRWV